MYFIFFPFSHAMLHHIFSCATFSWLVFRVKSKSKVKNIMACFFPWLFAFCQFLLMCLISPALGMTLEQKLQENNCCQSGPPGPPCPLFHDGKV
jgi:hypothetical protein